MNLNVINANLANNANVANGPAATNTNVAKPTILNEEDRKLLKTIFAGAVSSGSSKRDSSGGGYMGLSMDGRKIRSVKFLTHVTERGWHHDSTIMEGVSKWARADEAFKSSDRLEFALIKLAEKVGADSVVRKLIKNYKSRANNSQGKSLLSREVVFNAVNAINDSASKAGGSVNLKDVETESTFNCKTNDGAKFFKTDKQVYTDKLGDTDKGLKISPIVGFKTLTDDDFFKRCVELAKNTGARNAFFEDEVLVSAWNDFATAKSRENEGKTEVTKEKFFEALTAAIEQFNEPDEKKLDEKSSGEKKPNEKKPSDKKEHMDAFFKKFREKLGLVGGPNKRDQIRFDLELGITNAFRRISVTEDSWIDKMSSTTPEQMTGCGTGKTKEDSGNGAVEKANKVVRQTGGKNTCWFLSVYNALGGHQNGPSHLAKIFDGTTGRVTLCTGKKNVSGKSETVTYNLGRNFSTSDLESCVMNHLYRYRTALGVGDYKIGDYAPVDATCKMLGLLPAPADTTLNAGSTANEFAALIKRRLSGGEIVTFNINATHFISIAGIEGQGGDSILTTYDSIDGSEKRMTLTDLLARWPAGSEEARAGSLYFMKIPSDVKADVLKVKDVVEVITKEQLKQMLLDQKSVLEERFTAMVNEVLLFGRETYLSAREMLGQLTEGKDLVERDLYDNLLRRELINRQINALDQDLDALDTYMRDYKTYLETDHGVEDVATWKNTGVDINNPDAVMGKFAEWVGYTYYKENNAVVSQEKKAGFEAYIEGLIGPHPQQDQPVQQQDQVRPVQQAPQKTNVQQSTQGQTVGVQKQQKGGATPIDQLFQDFEVSHGKKGVELLRNCLSRKDSPVSKTWYKITAALEKGKGVGEELGQIRVFAGRVGIFLDLLDRDRIMAEDVETELKDLLSKLPAANAKAKKLKTDAQTLSDFRTQNSNMTLREFATGGAAGQWIDLCFSLAEDLREFADAPENKLDAETRRKCHAMGEKLQVRGSRLEQLKGQGAITESEDKLGSMLVSEFFTPGDADEKPVEEIGAAILSFVAATESIGNLAKTAGKGPKDELKAIDEAAKLMTDLADKLAESFPKASPLSMLGGFSNRLFAFAGKLAEAVETLNDGKKKSRLKAFAPGEILQGLLTGSLDLNTYIGLSKKGIGHKMIDTSYGDASRIDSVKLGKGNENEVTKETFRNKQTGVEKTIAVKDRDTANTAVLTDRLPFLAGSGSDTLESNFYTSQAANVLGVGNRVPTVRGTKDSDGNVKIGMGLVKGVSVNPKGQEYTSKHLKVKTHVENKETGKKTEVEVPLHKLKGEPRLKVRGDLIRQLNELEWVDLLSGEQGRHTANYMYDLTDKGAQVYGVDNDKSFLPGCVGCGKYRMKVSDIKSQLKDIIMMGYETIMSQPKSFRGLFGQDAALWLKTFTDDKLFEDGANESVDESTDLDQFIGALDVNAKTRKDRPYDDNEMVTIDCSKIKNHELGAANFTRYLTKVSSMRRPTFITRSMLNRLLSLKGPKSKEREAYLATFGERKSGNVENAIREAAEARLDDTIRIAEELARKGRVIENPPVKTVYYVDEEFKPESFEKGYKVGNSFVFHAEETQQKIDDWIRKDRIDYYCKLVEEMGHVIDSTREINRSPAGDWADLRKAVTAFNTARAEYEKARKDNAQNPEALKASEIAMDEACEKFKLDTFDDGELFGMSFFGGDFHGFTLKEPAEAEPAA